MQFSVVTILMYMLVVVLLQLLVVYLCVKNTKVDYSLFPMVLLVIALSTRPLGLGTGQETIATYACIFLLVLHLYQCWQSVSECRYQPEIMFLQGLLAATLLAWPFW